MVSLLKSEIAFLETQCCTKVIQRVLRIAIFFFFFFSFFNGSHRPSWTAQSFKEFHLQFIPTEFD